jgi:hypothetical protein
MWGTFFYEENDSVQVDLISIVPDHRLDPADFFAYQISEILVKNSLP